MSTFDFIRPFLRQLEPFLDDRGVTEIMVNAGGVLPGSIFVEREGRIEPTDVTLDPRTFREALKRIARESDDEVSKDQPLLIARLADGSRVSAVLPPVAVDGPTMTIRKFGERFTLVELIANGGVPAAVATLLEDRIEHRQNILISGGTGTGKTTLLNALADRIPQHDRIVLIEDNSEVLIRQPRNLVRFEAQRAQLGKPAVTMTELVRQALRFRPDRIILGEVLGAEAADLLHALNTGHRGSLSTIHGNTPEEALLALADYVLLAPAPLPYLNILRAIARAIQIVVHIDRIDGQRRVTEVRAVTGFDQAHDRFQTEILYPRDGHVSQ